MGSPGGYSVTPGLYRVPDLKTEEEFITYMREVYNVEVTFNHPGNKPTAVALRARGQARPMGVIDEGDFEGNTPVPIVDPVLAVYNSMDFGKSYSTTPKVEKEEGAISKSSSSTKSK